MKRFAAFAIACLLFGLFTRPQAVSAGTRQAAALCMDVLLPSMFVFLAIALFAAKSGASAVFSRLLSPLMRLMRLPAACGEIVLFSLCGGYPIGARLLAAAVSEGRISRRDAGRMLCFCFAPAPSFVVLAVGEGLFRSRALGCVLLGAQLASSLLCGILICRTGNPVALRGGRPMPFSAALTQSVSQAADSMLSIFAWVILCGALLPLLGGPAPLRSAATALFEVTNGCRLAGELGGMAGAVLAAFLLSFGGVGVLCQIAAVAAGEGIEMRGFLRSRIACGALSAALTAVWLRGFPQCIPAWAEAAEPMLFSSPNRMIGGICLCAMIAMTLSNLSVRERVDFSRRI